MRFSILSAVALLAIMPFVSSNAARAHNAGFTSTATPTPRNSAADTALPAPLPGLRLQVQPYLVDVGAQVTFTVSATRWSAPASVTIAVLSPHHGFSGRLNWNASCACFQLGVVLARRIHALETARATATVVMRRTSYVTRNTFLVRGLAKNGRDFAPGGTAHLRGWVADPTPVANETEHYCAWVLTADGLGIKGVKVRFVASYSNKSTTWSGKPTNVRGVSCVRKVLRGPAKGTRVRVDIYAGGMHVRTSFVQSS